MEKLMEILSQHEVEGFEAAEMIYVYLMEFGNSTDKTLLDALYNTFLSNREGV